MLSLCTPFLSLFDCLSSTHNSNAFFLSLLHFLFRSLFLSVCIFSCHAFSFSLFLSKSSLLFSISSFLSHSSLILTISLPSNIAPTFSLSLFPLTFHPLYLQLSLLNHNFLSFSFSFSLPSHIALSFFLSHFPLLLLTPFLYLSFHWHSPSFSLFHFPLTCLSLFLYLTSLPVFFPISLSTQIPPSFSLYLFPLKFLPLFHYLSSLLHCTLFFFISHTTDSSSLSLFSHIASSFLHVYSLSHYSPSFLYRFPLTLLPFFRLQKTFFFP